MLEVMSAGSFAWSFFVGCQIKGSSATSAASGHSQHQSRRCKPANPAKSEENL
jgi:hypothetical protein